jgi:hypothetical protein
MPPSAAMMQRHRTTIAMGTPGRSSDKSSGKSRHRKVFLNAAECKRRRTDGASLEQLSARKDFFMQTPEIFFSDAGIANDAEIPQPAFFEQETSHKCCHRLHFTISSPIFLVSRAQ